MTPLRVLIVDDEPLIRRGIREALVAFTGVEVVGECGRVAEAVDAIRAGSANLAFLDVELADGTGFDVISQITPAQMPNVVFVTAYDRYAIQAFEVNAVDYLLKPFSNSRLYASLERVRSRLTDPAEALARRLDSLMQTREPRWPETLVVRNGDRFDIVAVSTVDWIEAANNYTVVHCGSVDHILSETLTGVEGKLDPARFIRVHRSAIVNSARIVAVHTILGGAYELELRGGTRIRTGRQFRDKIRRIIEA